MIDPHHAAQLAACLDLPIREHISLVQKANPGVLEVIRDLLLAGHDVDAVALLGTELDLVPRAKRMGIVPIGAVNVSPRQRLAIVRRINSEYPFAPLRFGVTERTGEHFLIESIIDAGTNRHLIEGGRPLHASVFVAARSKSDFRHSIFELNGIITLEVEPPNLAHTVGITLPFPRWWTRSDAVTVNIYNDSDEPHDFEGFIIGEDHAVR